MNRKKLISTLSVASAVLATGLLVQEAKADEVVPSPQGQSSESSGQAVQQAYEDLSAKSTAYNDTVAIYNQQVATVNTAVETANTAAAEANTASQAVTNAQTAVTEQQAVVANQTQVVNQAQAEATQAENAYTNPDEVTHEVTTHHQENNALSMNDHRNVEDYYATPDIIDGTVTQEQDYDPKENYADVQPAEGKTDIKVELTDAQVQELKDTHVVKYEINNDEVNKYAVEYINQIRQQNGLTVGDNNVTVQVGGSTKAWAQLRAEENAANEVVGHESHITAAQLHAAGAYNGDTNDTNAGWTHESVGMMSVLLGYTDKKLGYNGDDSLSFDEIWGYKVDPNTRRTMSNSMVVSDQQLAYHIVTGLLYDFGNKHTRMGHARGLLQPADFAGFGLAVRDLTPALDENNNEIPGLMRANIYYIMRRSVNPGKRIKPNYEYYVQDNGFMAIKNLENGSNISNLPLLNVTVSYKEKPDMIKLKQDLDTANAKLASASTTLDNAKAELTNREAARSQAGRDYAVANQKATDAKAVVDAEKATLATLRADYDKAKTARDQAQAHYDTVKAVFDAQEAERKATELAAQKAREEAEKKAAEQKAKEEVARLEAERQAKEAAALAARQEAERKAQVEKAAREAAAQAQVEAGRKAQEAAQAQAEAKRLAEEAEKAAAADKAEAEAKARAAQAEAERKAQEAATAAEKATNANQTANNAQVDATQAETIAKAAEEQAKVASEQANTAIDSAEVVTVSDRAQANTVTALSYRTVSTSTAQATQAVINRRQAPSYQASLPETGDDNVAVYSLLGMAMIGLAGVGVNRKKPN